MKPDQELVVAGYIGERGTRLVAEQEKERLLTRFSKRYIEQIQEALPYSFQTEEARICLSQGATAWEEADEGGILAALWYLSEAHRVGIRFTLKEIPVRQETIEICEYIGLNPYRLLSGQCMVLAVNRGSDLIERLGQCGIPAAVIGKVTEGMKREMIHGEGIGYLEKPVRAKREK